MSQTLVEQLGIWENKTCLKCGACCYNYRQNQICENQEIINGSSCCKKHDDPKRDIICQTWFCSYLDEDSKSEFRELARQLGTNPNLSLNIF